MAELTLEEHEERVPIPDGEILAAELVFCDTAQKTYKKEEGPKDVIRFKFKVTEPGQFKDRLLTADLNPWFSTDPRCRLRPWILELLGYDELPAGFKLETTMLVGTPCRIVVSARTYRARDNSDQIANDVTDVLGARQGVAAQEAF